jgi:hypothetical protein
MKDLYKYREFKLKDKYSPGTKVSETRTSVCHESRVGTSSRVILFSSKYTVQSGSDSEKDLSRYFDVLISVLQNGHLGLVEYGIDIDGYAYIVVDYFESSPLYCDGKDSSQIFLWFIKCVQEVNEYQISGLPIGDLSLSSFRLRSPTDVILLPSFSGIEKSNNQTINLSISKYLEYIAPEQRISGDSSFTGDVYSMGVVGYYLSQGTALSGTINSIDIPLLKCVEAPSKTNPAVPQWFDHLIGNTLAPDPRKRIKDATTLLSLLEKGIKNNILDVPNVPWITYDLIKTQQNSRSYTRDGNSITTSAQSETDVSIKNGAKGSHPAKQKKKKSVSRSRRIVLLIWISTIIVGAGISLMVFLSFRVVGFSSDNLSEDLRVIYSESTSDALRKEILLIADDSISDELRIDAIRKVIGKKSHWDARLAKLLSTSKLGSFVIDDFIHALDASLRQFGYEGLVSVVNESIHAINLVGEDVKTLDSISYILIAIDPNETSEMRKGAMRRFYSIAELSAFKIVALLGVESTPSVFLPLLRDFVITKYYPNIPQEISRSVLFALTPPLRVLLGEDINEWIRKLEDDEIKELSRIILDSDVRSDDPIDDLVFEEYVSRFSLSTFEKYFLDVSNDKFLTSSEKRILYKLAFGSATHEDLNFFVEWNDNRWEELIYTICITSKDNKMLERALDILQRRGAFNRRAESLLKWIKNYFWSKRSIYAYSIGILTLKEKATKEEIEEAFLRLMPVSQHGLFTALVEIGEPFFITEAAVRLAPILTSNELTPLLYHELKDVRIATIKALVGKNDLTTLQKIIRAYKKEKDPEIRAIYNTLHWVTQDQEIPDSLKSNHLNEFQN